MSRIEDFLEKFSKVLARTDGLDKSLKILIYSLKIIHHLKTHGNSFSMSNLAEPLSLSRVCMRIFGLVPIIKSSMQLHLSKNPSLDKDTQILMLKLLSMAIFYPAEHLYLLGSTNSLKIQNLSGMARTSSKAWGLYILLDLYAQQRLYSNSLKQQIKLAESRNKQNESENLKIKKRELFVKVATNLCDLPMAIHWSLKSSPFPPLLISALGLASGALSMSRIVDELK